MRLNRRDFVRAGALLTALPALPSWVRGAASLAQSDSATREMEAIRDRFLRAMTPANVQEIAATAERDARALPPNGQWPTVDYQDQSRSQWKTTQHLLNILTMSIAYCAAEFAEPQKSTLRDKIDLALQWWFTHDPHNPNWWHNEIGVPKFLGTIALFMGDGIDDASRSRVIEMMKRADWTRWTGQNLVWGTQIQILRGILAHEPQTVAQAYARMYDEIRIGPPAGEGIMPDFSFHQHGSQLYSGGYGLNFANDVGGFLGFAWGTSHQISADKMQIYTRYVLDGEAWMTRGDVFDYSACGREITRKGKLASPPDVDRATVANPAAAFHLADTAAHLGGMDVPRRDEFSNFSARLRSAGNARPLTGNRHFWCSDYMTHQRPDFFTSVRMFSTRTLNAELVNSEGKQSHHLADGCTYIYRRGDEYRDIFPAWNWSQVPGTTAEQMDLLKDGGGNPRYKTDAEFVGGVSDGNCGVAAQQLHRDTLRVKKMWMMFEDGFIALGSDINCDSDREVVTTLNQCLLRGDVRETSETVIHDEVGYDIAAGPGRRLFHGPQTGRWSDIGVGSDQPLTQQIFRLWLEHGVRPKNAGYAYVVYPVAARLTKSPAPRVLANTSEVQAAYVPSSKLTGAAFWAAGSLDNGEKLTFSTDAPCLLLIQELAGKFRVSASNPVNRALKFTVTVNRKLRGENASATKQGTSIGFDLPGDALAGSTIVRELDVAT